MKKSISVERTYFLGQFKNIRYSTTIEDIPDEILFNLEAMDALRQALLLEADRAYFTYVKDSLTMGDNNIKPEEALELLDKVALEKAEKTKLAFAEEKPKKAVEELEDSEGE